MVKTLTLADLEAGICHCHESTCDNSKVYFHQVCHPMAGTYVSYEKGSGEISITCRICELLITKIAVAQSN